MVWLGGAVVLVRAVGPAADALGDDAMAFMRELNLKGPLPNIIMLSALSTLVFGWLLYYNNFGDRMVFSTISTSALSIGALLGTAAFFEAFFLIKRSSPDWAIWVNYSLKTSGANQAMRGTSTSG